MDPVESFSIPCGLALGPFCEPDRGFARQPCFDRGAAYSDNTRRQRDRFGAEVANAMPATRPHEVQDIRVVDRHPFQLLHRLQTMPQPQGLPVELQCRANRPSCASPPSGRSLPAAAARPRRRRSRTSRRRRPRQRHPAAVAALRCSPLSPDRVLQRRGGQVGDLVQAQLLALVEVRRSGQRQHQQRRRAGPAQARARSSSARQRCRPLSSQASRSVPRRAAP